MALTTLMSVKSQGGIPAADTSRDGQIRILIDGITSLVKQQLNREIESAEYTEYYSGDGSPFLLLRQYPVTSVSLVCLDDAGYFGAAPGGFDSSLNLVEGVDYALMSGVAGLGATGTLRRIGTTWHRYPSRAIGVIQNLPGIPSGNIKVQYTAGFDVVPPAIVMAVNAAILKQLAMSSFGGAASQLGYEDASVSFVAPADVAKLFGSIESILANYRSIPV